MLDQPSSSPRSFAGWFWILAVSLILRVILALQGGQGYFGDEFRYLRGPILYESLLEGNEDRVKAILKQPQHAGFIYVSLLVAPLHQALAHVDGAGAWSHFENISRTLTWAAVALGLFSTLNLWLLYQLALRSGASRREAEMVLLLAAAAQSLFYYSRHLLPYDSSLTLALLAFIFSISGTNPKRLFLAGVASALTYQIYNGYWFLVPTIGFVVLLCQPSWPTRLRAGWLWGFGVVCASAIIALPGIIISGRAYFVTAATFSRTVNQGLFTEGWSLPWAYLWQTEGPAGVSLAVLAFGFIVRDSIRRALPTRMVWWIASAVTIYALLVLFSVGLGKFVVYGRTVRPLVFFFCLIAGYTLEQLLVKHPRWRPIMVSVIIMSAAINFAPNFFVSYLQETKMMIWKKFGIPKQTISFSGSYYPNPVKQVTRPDLILVNGDAVYPLRQYLGYPAGRILFSVPHPENFGPYQYEGLTPRERGMLNEHPLFIRLIQLDDPGSTPDNPPADLLMKNSDVSGFDQN